MTGRNRLLKGKSDVLGTSDFFVISVQIEVCRRNDNSFTTSNILFFHHKTRRPGRQEFCDWKAYPDTDRPPDSGQDKAQGNDDDNLPYQRDQQ